MLLLNYNAVRAWVQGMEDDGEVLNRQHVVCEDLTNLLHTFYPSNKACDGADYWKMHLRC